MIDCIDCVNFSHGFIEFIVGKIQDPLKSVKSSS